MSLALFPNEGSSASVAVTRATVVPVGRGGVRVTRCGSASRGGGGDKAITPRGVGGLEDWGVQDLPQRFLFGARLC